MEYISIVALIGISFTIFASAYSSPENFGISIGLYLIGLVFIACWFFVVDHPYLEYFAMILVGIGQLTLWGIVHYIKSELLTISDTLGAIVFMVVVWGLAIIIFLYRLKQSDKLERERLEHIAELQRKPLERIQSERKSFSKYIKDEILERQQNKCAMCNSKLFYWLC